MPIERQWHRPRNEAFWGLLAFVIGYGLMLGITVNHVSPHSSFTSKVVWTLGSLVYVLVSAALAYRVFVHSALIATDEGLTIANPFRSNQHLWWGEISSMRADRLLRIQCQDGRVVIAWTVQKNGWSRMKGRRTDADEVIDEVGRLAGLALNTPPKNFALN